MKESTSDKYQATVLQRPGSVIPMCNLVQSTVDYSTDSLTLIVNLNAEGRAVGMLYEDEGDGFGYRDGDYAVSEIDALVVGRMLKVCVKPVSGKRQSNVKYLRIGMLQKGKMKYSPWTSGCEVTMRMK